MKRVKTKKYIIFAIIMAILAITWVKFDYDLAKETPFNKDNTETSAFFIKQGATAKEIAADLQQNGLINNETYFYWYLRMNNYIPDILAGRFMLSPAMTYEDIAKTIIDAKQAQFVITVQEGLRIKDIDKKLVEMKLIKQGDFVSAAQKYDNKTKYPFISTALLSGAQNPLEGYLYPDTYFLDPLNYTNEDLIEKMLDNFANKTKDLRQEAEDKNQNFQDVVNMASILEKEVRTQKDLSIVAGILWKRLNTPGWTMGADATLLYLKDDNKITSADLAMDSPYNTRRKGGLPPSPICNPSIKSITAALNPKESDYWFYLTTLDTGEVIYARTNEEHNQNRAKHL